MSNKSKKIDRLFLKTLVLLCCFSLLFSGCKAVSGPAETTVESVTEKATEKSTEKETDTKEESTSGSEVVEKPLQMPDALKSFPLDYELNTPGKQLSYRYLWAGYDTENKFGPNFSEEERFYTYLTEYKECDGNYYLVYLKTDNFGAFETWLQSYEKTADSANNPDYHFTAYNDKTVIDGKYLYCLQNANSCTGEIFYMTVDSLDDIQFEIDGKQLIFCARGKQAIIERNVSTGDAINKEIFLLSRCVLQFADTNSAPTLYTNFTADENRSESQIAYLFDYVGEAIEAFPETYEDMTVGFFPSLGLIDYNGCLNIRAVVVEENGKKYFRLPRYRISGENKYDLLSDSTSFVTDEDVFGEFKSNFLDAYVKDIDDTTGEGLYDYDKVARIILMNGIKTIA